MRAITVMTFRFYKYVDQYTVDFNAMEDEVINSNFASMQAILEGSQTFYARDNNTTLSTICHQQDIRNDPTEENNEQSIIDENNVTLCLIIEVKSPRCLLSWNIFLTQIFLFLRPSLACLHRLLRSNIIAASSKNLLFKGGFPLDEFVRANRSFSSLSMRSFDITSLI